MATSNPTRRPLTDAQVEALESRDKIYTLADPFCRGLHVRVEKSGNKTWWLNVWTPEGAPKHQRYAWRLGEVSTFKLFRKRQATEEARQQSIRDYAEIIRAKALTVDLREQKREASRRNSSEKLASLGDFIDLHYYDLYKAKGCAEPDKMIKWFKGAFGDMNDLRMDRITHLTIRAWILQQKKTKTDSTVARLQGALSAILSEAVSQGHIPHHPLQKAQRDNSTTRLTLVKQDKGIVRYLNESEEKRLRAALAGRDKSLKAARARHIIHKQERGLEAPVAIRGPFADHMTPLILIAMNTGIRRGALLGMRWEDIRDGKIKVTKGLDKAKKGYSVDMNLEVTETLRLWKRQSGGNGLVFKYKSKQIYSIKTAWGNLLKKANITNFRFHDLRHHFATRLAESGAAPATIKELMGHSSIKMTDKYMHATDKMKSSAVELIRR
jgi:integrase